MKKINNIFLVGPMGAGKSSIGKCLAEELGFVFHDTDQEIEKATGVSVSWIFDVEGEAGFRKRERSVVKKIGDLQGVVLSTGGGTILDADSRTMLAARGMVIYLYATVDQQYERVYKDSNRPLMMGNDPKGSLKAIFSERDSLYREIADIVIDTNYGNPRSIATNIVKEIQDS